MFQTTDSQKIGVALVAFGVSFLFLGVVLLFDKGLLAIGNILFLCGLAFVIGLERTFRFFFQRHKIKGSVAFFGGILIVLFGWPLIGMIVEIYGFILLFSGFFPFAINFLRRVPVIGSLLNMPGISKYVDQFAGDTGRSNVWCCWLCLRNEKRRIESSNANLRETKFKMNITKNYLQFIYKIYIYIISFTKCYWKYFHHSIM